MKRRLIALMVLSILAPIASAQTGDLTVAVFSAPDPVMVGEELRYHIEVGNLGPDDASNVTLNVMLDWRLTFSFATWSQGGCIASGSSVECEFGDVPAATSLEVTITVNAIGPGTAITDFDVGRDAEIQDFVNDSVRNSTTVTSSQRITR